MGKKHAEAYRSIPDVKVVCIVDPDEEKGKALAEQMHCCCKPSIKFVEKDEADLIDICLPTFLHTQAIFEAAKICRNIICEKPLALDPAEIDVVEKLVKEQKLRLMVAQVVRFMDKYAAAKAMADENAVGKINTVTCWRRQKKPDWIVGGWLSKQALSGGLAYDLAIHDLDYMAWLLGRPNKIFASSVNAADGSAAHLRAQIEFDGCIASVFSSWGMPAGYREGELTFFFEIIGETGRIYGDSDEIFTISDGKGTQDISLERCDGYREELAYFVRCIRNDEVPVLADIKAVRTALDMARAINLSITLGRAVDMDEVAMEQRS